MPWIIYLLSFAISAYLLYKSGKVSKKWVSAIFVILAIILPSLVAGLRSLTVGTDVNVYLSPLYESAVSSGNFEEYLDSAWATPSGVWHVRDVEPLFTGLVYVISVIFKNVSILLFLIQILIMILVYGAIRNCVREERQWLAYSLFLLILFNPSLNMMRQVMGLSVAVFGLSFVLKDNKKRNVIAFLLAAVIAFFFHRSSAMIAVPFLLYEVANYSKKNVVIFGKISVRQLTLVIIGLMLFVGTLSIGGMEFLPDLLSSFGMNKYALYLSGETSIGLITVARIVPVIYMLYLLIKKKEKGARWNFCLTLFLAHILTIIISSRTIYASRIGYVFDFVECLIIPSIISEKSKRAHIEVSVILLYYMVLWVVLFALLGASNTVPYYFIWQEVGW